MIIDYDGGIDMIMAYDNYIKIYLNQKSLSSDNQFCCEGCKNFALSNPIYVYIPDGQIIKEQSLHFGDINIDGYPDLLLVVVD